MKKIESPNSNTINKTVGEYVSEDYRTAKIFEKYGVDFGTWGKGTLSTICKEKKLDFNLILQEIESIKTDIHSYGMASLTEFINNMYQFYLSMNATQILSDLLMMAETHGAVHPELYFIADIFTKINNDIASHLKSVDESFFPAIQKLEGTFENGCKPEKEEISMIMQTILKLCRGHEEICTSFKEIRFLTRDYLIPTDGGNTLTLTYLKLRDIADTLQKHFHGESRRYFQ